MPARRSIFLINKRFQLRFAIYVCSWLFAMSLAYPLIIQSLFDYFIRYLSADPNGPELASLQGTRSELVWLLVLMQVVFLTVTFLISIFMSHRIAGPLFKLKKFFEEAKDGKIATRLSFRKRDHFQDLAVSYNVMADAVTQRTEAARAGITRSLELLDRAAQSASGDGKANLDEARKALTKARDELP